MASLSKLIRAAFAPHDLATHWATSNSASDTTRRDAHLAAQCPWSLFVERSDRAEASTSKGQQIRSCCVGRWRSATADADAGRTCLIIAAGGRQSCGDCSIAIVKNERQNGHRTGMEREAYRDLRQVRGGREKGETLERSCRNDSYRPIYKQYVCVFICIYGSRFHRGRAESTWRPAFPTPYIDSCTRIPAFAEHPPCRPRFVSGNLQILTPTSMLFKVKSDVQLVEITVGISGVRRRHGQTVCNLFVAAVWWTCWRFLMSFRGEKIFGYSVILAL